MGRTRAPARILITGGAGFVGYHLARHLLGTTAARLTLVDNLQRGRMDQDLKELLTEQRIRFLKRDLTDPGSFVSIGSGYDHVYHLAAVNGTKHFYKVPHAVLRTNILSLIHMLEWMRVKNSKGKLLFTSSNEAYAGALDFGALPLPTPENVPLVIADTYNPRWSYAGSKLIGEQLVIHYATAHKLRALIVRPHNFYGPRAGFDHVIPEFIRRLRTGKEPFDIFGPRQTRSFCYIEDAVEAMARLMRSAKTDRRPIETVHIGSAEEISIRKLAEVLFAVHGKRPKKITIRQPPSGSVARRIPAVSKIRRLIDWQATTALADGLAKTYEWYAGNRL